MEPIDSKGLRYFNTPDFDLYYHGERCTSDQPQSLTYPFCGEMGFGFPYLNESSSSNNSTQNVDLFQHLQTKHVMINNHKKLFVQFVLL